MSKIAIILGTRPEIIKMSPVVRECERRGLQFYIVHSNQHYSREMDAQIFEDLALPKAKYNLEVGSGTHGQQTGRILERVEAVLMEERPDYVLVHGDVNTTLAGALAARKLLIPVGHVEAGLRSFDKSMPEEVNRVLVDHISDYCFAPTIEANNNLVREGVLSAKVALVGNTVVDACQQNMVLAKTRRVSQLEGFSGGFLTLTLHRQENTDDESRLREILRAVEAIAEQNDLDVLFPVHPRTTDRLRKYGITLSPRFSVCAPFGYLDFLHILSTTRLVLTDSGGIQEEACIAQVPCVTIRENTERPESVQVGANIIAGVSFAGITAAASTMLKADRQWENPFGDGRASQKIISRLLDGAKQ